MNSISTGRVAFSSELRVYCIIIRGSRRAEHNDEENDKRGHRVKVSTEVRPLGPVTRLRSLRLQFRLQSFSTNVRVRIARNGCQRHLPSHHRRFSKIDQSTSECNTLNITYENCHPSSLRRPSFTSNVLSLPPPTTSAIDPPIPFPRDPLLTTSYKSPDLPHLKEVAALSNGLPFVTLTFPCTSHSRPR